MIPGLSPKAWALLLAYPLGLMGVLTTYTAGHNPIYYGSGYITRQAFWGLGLVLGRVLPGRLSRDRRALAAYLGV